MAIKLQQVSYMYDARSMLRQTALEHVDLELGQGLLTGIAGASGSGKSTLLQMLNGILLPTEGTVNVLDITLAAGKKPPKLGSLRRRVGLVFQFPEQQLFAATLEEDLSFGPINFGASPAEASSRVRQAMERMGLDESLLARHPLQLSGGQRRKAAIASVLAMDPDVLVLDEPGATLDQESRTELTELLYKLCREEGKTVIIVTHRMDELLPYADRWVIMHEGKAAFSGTPRELVDQAEKLAGCGLTVPQPIQYWLQLEEAYGLQAEDPCFSPDALAGRLAKLASAGDRKERVYA
ncbi:ATP-binding cassette domain-containing protein [Paenibacillus sp.]|jgi:energy-coupling factor transport system ATP-binding protein|uniref:ATP-binding cassette domain-containing protein n=1 Tax=Paenibacillus sp. TaxID=58172 RepID=UPI00282DF8C7|nr:ATP-binding cassette domain-containing protein [Paenibacillus sp.]MDR0269196.1 ATP-binding cassette domain-containing protein [Paenibacillus sp.]